MRHNRKLDSISQIASGSDDILKKYMIENHDKYNLDSYDVYILTKSIKDDNYKANIIKNLDEYAYKTYQIIDILCSIENDELKNEIICNYKKYNIDEFDIYTAINSMSDKGILFVINSIIESDNKDLSVQSVVKYLKDDDLKKDFVSDFKKYNLSPRAIADIITSINDDEYKKQIVEDNKNYNFDSFCLSDIIYSISDEEYKFSIIKKHDKYGLFSDDVKFIADSFVSEKYIFSIIDNYETLGFDKTFLANIISILKDDGYKIEIIFENKYDFSNIELIKIVNSLSKYELKQEVMDKLYEKGVFKLLNTTKKIALPENMTIGIEIENEGSASRDIKDEILPEGWCSKMDSTLKKGNEAVSPILHRGDEEVIVRVCSFLKSLGQRTSERCAAHVHIGVQYFEDDVDAYKCLVELYSNIEDLIYLICNEKNSIPRRNILSYANPFNLKVSEAIKDNSLRFDSIDDVNKFARIIGIVQGSRFSSINFKNLGKIFKNTVEFRAANGTLDPDVWIDNINLFGGIMYVAKRVSELFKTDFDSLSRDDQVYLYLFENLKEESLDEYDKLKTFLSLLPSEIDTQVYLDRYDTNAKMYHAVENMTFLQLISTIKPIGISTCDEKLKKKIDDNYKKIFLKEKTSKR